MIHSHRSRPTALSRRSFIRLAAATAFGAAVGGCTSGAKQRAKQNQLNVYSWADYIHPDVIPEFERTYSVHVVYDTFSSNEALLARLQAGATAYDITVPTSYMVCQLRKLGVLSQIDHTRLPLLKNLMPRFQDPAFDPKLKYSVPYTWGTTGIGFNANAFESEKDYPTDWDFFWDKKLSGRMTLLDDSRETIGMAVKRRGSSYNTHDTKVIEAGAADLKQQKPLTMCYTSDQVVVQLAAGDSALALAYSGDVYQAAKDNHAVRYVIPHSGASLWLDNLCIPRSAPHPENAYKWLSFLLEPRIAAANAAHTRYATPNKLAYELINPVQRDDRNLYPNEELLSRCDELGDIGNEVFVYDRLWTEIKCS
jgi:spermidine/putrescine transport system substrate-binding protein